jgi:hypothetical protein
MNRDPLCVTHLDFRIGNGDFREVGYILSSRYTKDLAARMIDGVDFYISLGGGVGVFYSQNSLNHLYGVLAVLLAMHCL